MALGQVNTYILAHWFWIRSDQGLNGMQFLNPERFDPVPVL